MMRGLFALAAAGFAIAAVCMPLAIIGRAQDWSPYALTMLGAAAGFLVCLGMVMVLFATYDEGADDA